MNLNKLQVFWEELRIVGDDHTKSLNPFLRMLDAFSKVVGQSFYVIDYKKREFVYVSSNSLFLCGYTPKEVLEMNYTFYQKVVVEDDQDMLWEIDRIGHELFCRLSPDARIKSIISYDYRLKQPGDKIIMVNQRNTPIFLDEQGNVRFALCVVNLSTNNLPGNVIIKIDDILQYYVYSFERKKWKKAANIAISNRERDVLQLAAQGCSNEEIANILFINISTVKFHKTNIFTKLDVKNIAEAVTFAYNHKLL